MPTPWTAETLWPAQGEQIVAASLLARKARLEFELVARVILHQALHYILGSPESSGYPAYLEAYSKPEPKNRTGPTDWRTEIATSYEIIFDHLRGDADKLASFFARTSLRYDSLGVDVGTADTPTAAAYRKWARERVEEDRPQAILEALLRRLMALFKFLYGPSSFGLNPVNGPVPHSLLRCVHAMEASLAAEATAGRVGESNARISVNRATSKRTQEVQRQTRELYQAVFTDLTDPASRGRFFAAAIQRYRNWAGRVST